MADVTGTEAVIQGVTAPMVVVKSSKKGKLDDE